MTIRSLAAVLFAYVMLFPRYASAHVEYVLPEGHGLGAASWSSEVFEPLRDPAMLLLMLGTAAATAALYIAAQKISVVARYLKRVATAAESNRPLVPWMLRLGVGVALISAGVHGYLVSPVAEATPWLAGFEVLVGFGLLAGVLTGVGASLVLGFYALAVSQNIYVLGNAETAASAIVILMLADARPGVDQIFGAPFIPSLERWKAWAPVVLRVLLGGTMIFLAVWEKFLHAPASTEVVLMYGLHNIVPVSAQMWVLSAGIIEIAVGAFLLIGAFTRLTSAVAFLVLVTTFFFFREDVTAHVTLFATVSAVFVMGAGPWSADEAWHNRKR